MGHVLAEKGLAGFDVALRVTGPAIAEAAFNPKGEQSIVVEASCGQVREHASITAALSERSIDGAAWGEARIP